MKSSKIGDEWLDRPSPYNPSAKLKRAESRRRPRARLQLTTSPNMLRHLPNMWRITPAGLDKQHFRRRTWLGGQDGDGFLAPRKMDRVLRPYFTLRSGLVVELSMECLESLTLAPQSHSCWIWCYCTQIRSIGIQASSRSRGWSDDTIVTIGFPSETVISAGPRLTSRSIHP